MARSNPWGGIAGEAIIGKLEAKDIATDDIVLTVCRAFIESIFDKATGEVQDQRLVVEFDEFPGKGLKCNKTQAAAFRALVAAGKLPNKFNDVDESWSWEGLSVPLFKKDVMYEGETYPKLYPVAPGAFDRSLVEYAKSGGRVAKAKAQPRRSRTAK